MDPWKLDKIRACHPLTKFFKHTTMHEHNKLIKSICRYTGGGTRLYVLVPNYILEYATSKKISPSMLFTLGTEGYLMIRHMLDHRYPALVPLIKKQDKHKIILPNLEEIERYLAKVKPKQPGLRMQQRRTWRRVMAKNMGYFWRYRHQCEYMMQLQGFPTDGKNKHVNPQGTTTREMQAIPYYDEPLVPLLTHINKTLQNKYTVNDICKHTGGGTYVNITIPTYLKNHIDATDLKTPLFLILAIEDYLMLMEDDHAANLSKIIINLILHRAAAERKTPQDRIRAVLFRRHNDALRGVVNIYRKKIRGGKLKARCVIKEPAIRIRADRISPDYEGVTLLELRELNPDAYKEKVNNMWPDLDPDDKMMYDKQRYLKELQASGDTKETYGDDPEPYRDMDLPDLAEQYPEVLAQEVNRRWNTLNPQQQRRFDKARFDAENPDPW